MRPIKIFDKTRRRKTRPKLRKVAYKQRAAAEYVQALERQMFGSLGAASPVRRIDPTTGQIVAVIDPKSVLTSAKG
jgi:hypothetical protein